MITKKTLGVFFPILFIFFMLSSCTEKVNEWPPYVGYEWHAPYKGDSLCLKLATDEVVVLSSVADHSPLSTGKYKTHRGKFLFEELKMEMDSVSYNLEYALFTPTFEMVVYGDSLNAVCDTMLMEWNLPFCLL